MKLIARNLTENYYEIPMYQGGKAVKAVLSAIRGEAKKAISNIKKAVQSSNERPGFIKRNFTQKGAEQDIKLKAKLNRETRVNNAMNRKENVDKIEGARREAEMAAKLQKIVASGGKKNIKQLNEKELREAERAGKKAAKKELSKIKKGLQQLTKLQARTVSTGNGRSKKFNYNKIYKEKAANRVSRNIKVATAAGITAGASALYGIGKYFFTRDKNGNVTQLNTEKEVQDAVNNGLEVIEAPAPLEQVLTPTDNGGSVLADDRRSTPKGGSTPDVIIDGGRSSVTPSVVLEVNPELQGVTTYDPSTGTTAQYPTLVISNGTAQYPTQISTNGTAQYPTDTTVPTLKVANNSDELSRLQTIYTDLVDYDGNANNLELRRLPGNYDKFGSAGSINQMDAVNKKKYTDMIRALASKADKDGYIHIDDIPNALNELGYSEVLQ